MPKFFNKDLGDLAHQLTLSPRRLRADQLRAIEGLLATIDPEKTYPYEFVCYRITQYRHRGAAPRASIPGKALVPDLVAMAELLSRKARLTPAELGEPLCTHEELAKQFNVSTKTLRRWRSRGLMGLRIVGADGVSRLMFMRSTAERFRRQHKNLVARGAAFKQLSKAERERILARARELAADRPLKLHAAARLIARETGRAVETVRYTLRRHDAAATEPLFDTHAAPRHDARTRAIWDCHQRGDSVSSIARAMECSPDEVEQALRTVRVRQWQHDPPAYVPNELFEAPNADAIILDAPEPESERQPPPKIPKDTPPYLQSLYRTPLLTREQEADLFRRYNYLKYKAAAQLKRIDAATVSKAAFDQLAALMRQIDRMRQRIIRANLRLVVSIAKRHVGFSSNFFEVVSDGNVSLMRAVEKFDFSRGNKFSTYATWAITRNYARTIPEAYYRSARLLTGQDLALETTPDRSTEEAPAHPSDREHVRQVIEAGLQQLSKREREILRDHFGLNDRRPPATLEQIGARFGVTKERVRQIEQKALARLRELLPASLVDAM